jgi:UDP-N-acetylmuramoyl-L-alanyl-D-glutamate--2,6-diaminopimelate ligase
MTWIELHEVLRAQGLLRAESEPVPSIGGAAVTGIAYDSRRVQQGNVFVGLPGLRLDGSSFTEDAIARGAGAIVSEHDAPPDVRVSWSRVKDARLALAVLAGAFYEHPSARMQVIGVTGTNGKTTTAHLIASIFEAANIQCGIVGTVGHSVAGEVREALHTTPEAPDLQALLAEMADRGSGAAVMEVSSHALALRRVDGMVFSAGVFTNLTRDHLDFHGDMETYFRAKRRLFEMLPPDAPSLINIDDPRGAALAELTGRPVTYGIDRAADITPGPLSFALEGLKFDVRTPRGTVGIRSKLVGRPNVYNILAAVSVAMALNLSFDAIERGVAALRAVAGRFQIVSRPSDEFTVVVDYAHTDDALRNLLETSRPLARGRLITVFGCGGDRDRTKRPLMGAVAGRLSDMVVVTSDNPRNEDPARIIDEICLGVTADTWRDSEPRLLTIVDRREAISRAIELARPGDLVLIAGKGHEKSQVIGSRSVPFDDVAVAHEALGRRRSNSGVV